jgi:hypothetical protein
MEQAVIQSTTAECEESSIDTSRAILPYRDAPVLGKAERHTSEVGKPTRPIGFLTK